MQAMRWGLLVFALAVVVLAVGLPNTTLAWLRADYPWLGQPLNRIEHLSDTVGLVHVLMFAALAFAASLAFPRTRPLLLAAVLIAFAVLTELAQGWVPGRTPRVTDVGEDVLGVMVGLALGGCVRWARGRLLRNAD